MVAARRYSEILETGAEAVIRRMMAAAGLASQAELARELGVRRAAVTDAKRRRSIPAEWFLRLSRTRGLNPLWLETGQGARTIGEVPRPDPASFRHHEEEFSFVPMVKARVSGGGGSLETDGGIEAYYAFRHEWLRRKGRIGEMRLMRVTGESMEPTLRDEDIVLIDLSQSDVYPGKIYAVGIDQEIVVKRLDKKPGKLVLLSDNRQFYPPLEVTLDEGVDVRILGRVVWMARELP